MNIVETWCNDWIDAAKLAYSVGGGAPNSAAICFWVDPDEERAQIPSV